MRNVEPTQEIPPMTNRDATGKQEPPQPFSDPLATDAAKRNKLEAELAKMGLSPAEVRRLLDADPNAIANPAPAAPPGTVVRANAPVIAPALAPPKAPSVVAVNPNLPEFRESTSAEMREAEVLLREASLLRRREQYREAEAKCRDALARVPKDAAALELLGDILQGVARTDEALAVYQRATQADPKRASAEGKYADLLTRQQDWTGFDPEAVPKNSYVAVLLSALLPGAGQFYNGDVTKALFFLLCDVVFGYIVIFSPWGFQKGHRGGGISTSLMASVIVASVLYITALVDAYLTAKRGGASGGRSGWEI